MHDKRLANRVGLLIRRLRQQKGMSQENFADSCGLHRTYVGSIERGEKTITIETAYKITQALGLTLSHFFAILESQQEDINNFGDHS